jgi:hypothetical protein
MNLKEARHLLFKSIKPNLYKKWVTKHCKLFPCDSILMELLASKYSEVLEIKITDDPNLYHSLREESVDWSIFSNITDDILFFQSFFSFFFKKYPTFMSNEELYSTILLVEKNILNESILFPSFYLEFIHQDPFIYYLDISISIAFIQSLLQKQPPFDLKNEIHSFIYQYRFHIIDIHLQQKKHKELLSIFKQISLQFNILPFGDLSIEQIIYLRNQCDVLKYSFLESFRSHSFVKQKTKQLEIINPHADLYHLQNKDFIEIPFSESKQPSFIPPKNYKYHDFSISFKLYSFPIWMNCESFLIQPITKSTHSEYIEKESDIYPNFYLPSESFYQHFWIRKNSFHKSIYTNPLNHSFEMYFLDKNHKKILFNEYQYKVWFEKPQIFMFSYFDTKYLHQISHSHIWTQLIQNILYKSMNSLNNSQFDYQLLTFQIYKQLSWEEKTLSENLYILFQFILKFDCSLFSLEFSSFKYKWNHLYFKIDSILNLPLEYSFPEYFLLKKTEQEKYDKFIKDAFLIFYKNMIIQYFQKIINYTFPLFSYPHLSLDISPVCEYIWENQQLIPIQSSSFLEENVYLNEDIINEGVQNIGILVECPDYFKPSTTKIISLQKSVMIEEASQEDFCQFLDTITDSLQLLDIPTLPNEEMENDSDEIDDNTENESECDYIDYMDNDNMDNDDMEMESSD